MQETKLKLLERIVDRRQDSLYRFAYFRTGSQADAEDIVQDVLLRLFHSDCNLNRIDDVERYLWRAIANRCCDYHRHRRNATLPTERAAALADEPDRSSSMPLPSNLYHRNRISSPHRMRYNLAHSRSMPCY